MTVSDAARAGSNDATTATATNESRARVLNDKFYGSITKATDYETWEEQNVIMQEFSYYTIMNELSNIGIKDKIFMDVGCGPCPIGQKLVVKGAKKVIGVDVSQAMLDRATTKLEEKGIADKFELVQGDILEDSFEVEEKVDVVVASYVISAFISNSEVLTKFISRCKDMLKPGGYLVILEVCYTSVCAMTDDDKIKYGFSYSMIGSAPPEPFEAYNFTFFPPNGQFGTAHLFNLPPRSMFEAALSAGFSDIQYKRCYMSPALQRGELLNSFEDSEYVHSDNEYALICRNEKE